MILTTLLLTGATVTLPARAEVRGTEIELGEVARITCEDATLRASLEAFDLGYAPAPGFSRFFESARVAHRLRESFPGVELVVAGEASFRIHPETEIVSGAAITALAREELGRLSFDKDARYEPTQPVADLVVPAGDVDATLRVRRDPLNLHPGTNSVPIEVLVDGAVYQTVWTTWDVQMWEPVLVLVRDVAAGQELGPDAVELRRVPASRTTQLGISREQLVGTRAARALPRGAVLQRNDVVQLELIHRGDTIVLEVKKGAVCARVAAVASEDGHMNERIRVVATDTQRELTAVVVGRDRVQIDISPAR